MPFIPDNNSSKPTPGFVPDNAASSPSDPIKDFMAGRTGVQTQTDPNDTYVMKNALQTAPESGVGMLNPVFEAGFKELGRPAKGVGDWLMQKAVGMKKYIPGVGEELADNGVIGTRGMMRDQVNSALNTTGQKIGELAKKVPNVNTDSVAQRMTDEAMKLVQPDGFINPADMSKYQQLMESAEQVMARGGEEGAVSGEVAGSARAASGRVANESGAYRLDPSQATKAVANRTEQAGWSDALKAGDTGAAPEVTDALTKADSTYSNLSKARRPLNAPQSIPQSAIGTISKLGLGGLLGGSVAGIPGAAVGAALGSPLGMSVGGRSAIGLGKLLSNPATADTAAGLATILRGKDQK